MADFLYIFGKFQAIFGHLPLIFGGKEKRTTLQTKNCSNKFFRPVAKFRQHTIQCERLTGRNFYSIPEKPFDKVFFPHR